MEEGWNSAVAAAVEFVPKFLGFLAILIIGYIVAKIVAKIVDRVLEKVGFDRAVERGGVKRALGHSGFDASDIVAKLVYYILLLFVLQLAFGVFGPNPISELITSVIEFLPKLVVAIIIVVVAAAIAAAVKTLIEGSLGGLSYGKALANIASLFIIGLGIIAALEQVGVATAITTPILIAVLATIGGILVVGVGGGLITPMRSRWERYLTAAESELPKIKEQVNNAPSLKDQTQQAMARMDGTPPPATSVSGSRTRPPA